MLKKLLLAAAAVSAFAGSANAAFLVTGGTATSPLDADNSYASELNGFGFDTLVNGAGLSVSYTGSKALRVFIVGAESGYKNTFVVDGSTFTETGGTEAAKLAFDPLRWAGSVDSLAGIGFYANGTGSLQGPGSNGFGVFVKGPYSGSYSANQIWLGFDDINKRAGDDDNHDDFVVRISEVPEPATWLTMIAGFGLIGYQLRRRQGKVATTVA